MPAVCRRDGPVRQELPALSLRLSGKISIDSIELFYSFTLLRGLLLALPLTRALTRLFT